VELYLHSPNTPSWRGAQLGEHRDNFFFFLTLREEHRLRMFENRMLRRIFGPKREEVAGGWRRLHNEELHNVYASTNIIRVIKSRNVRWTVHEARVGDVRNSYNILVG
jgi:hypothetical protein